MNGAPLAAPTSDPSGDDLGALILGPTVLSEGNPQGPLAGLTGVVKDLFDIRGIRTGAGNPDYLAEASPAESMATAVERLIDAGVTVIGKSITDELAYSIMGTNAHYGTPHNSAAPGHSPGGSSSGSASAVSGGLADVALGTDTGGSIRVPASWCGLFGMRPTHGRVPMDGVVPLAPSYDTVGWLARSGKTLRNLGRAMLADSNEPTEVDAVLVAEDLLALTDPAVQTGLRTRADDVAEQLTGRRGQSVEVVGVNDSLDEWFRGFFLRQQWESWRAHGRWITERRPNLGSDIAQRFAAAAEITSDDLATADLIRRRIQDRLKALVPRGAVLVVPVTLGCAPTIGFSGPEAHRIRMQTLAINSLASSTGSPTVVVPGTSLDGLPVGLGLLARRNSDALLLDAAAQLDPI